jgi:hypothetical protein
LLSPGSANLSFAPLAAFEAANAMLAEPYYESHVVSPSIRQKMQEVLWGVRTRDGALKCKLSHWERRS